jgi:hypothetical protein
MARVRYIHHFQVTNQIDLPYPSIDNTGLSSCEFASEGAFLSAASRYCTGICGVIIPEGGSLREEHLDVAEESGKPQAFLGKLTTI